MCGLRQEELLPTNLVEKTKRDTFDSDIKRLLGDSLSLPEEPTMEALNPMHDYDFDKELDPTSADYVIPEANAADLMGKPITQQSMTNLLINTEVLMDHGKTQQMARVIY